jgi:hypothetical protein
MFKHLRIDHPHPPGRLEVPTELEFCFEAEDILSRAKDRAEDIRTRTEKLLCAPPTVICRSCD